jgi:hypothetical protein
VLKFSLDDGYSLYSVSLNGEAIATPEPVDGVYAVSIANVQDMQEVRVQVMEASPTITVKNDADVTLTTAGGKDTLDRTLYEATSGQPFELTFTSSSKPFVTLTPSDVSYELRHAAADSYTVAISQVLQAVEVRISTSVLVEFSQRDYPASSGYRYLYDAGVDKPLVVTPALNVSGAKWKFVEVGLDTFRLVSGHGHGVSYAATAVNAEVGANRYYACNVASSDRYTVETHATPPYYWIKRVGGSGIDKSSVNNQFDEYGSGAGTAVRFVVPEDASFATAKVFAMLEGVTSLSFGEVTVGLPSAPKTMTIFGYNLTAAPTATLKLGGDSPFSVTGQIALNSDGVVSGVLTVAAKSPAATGGYKDTLTITGETATLTIPLSATGVVTEIPVALSPSIAPSDGDKWYYLYCGERDQKGVIQDFGAGERIEPKPAVAGEPRQLWKVVAISSGNYVFVSKLGNQLNVNGFTASDFYYTSPASPHTFSFLKYEGDVWQVRDNNHAKHQLHKTNNDSYFIGYTSGSGNIIKLTGSGIVFYPQETASSDGLALLPQVSTYDSEYWYQIQFGRQKESGKVIQDNGEGVNLSQAAQQDTTAQYWKITKTEEGRYIVESYAGLQMASVSSKYQAAAQGNLHQFEHYDNASLRLKNITTNSYLSDDNGTEVAAASNGEGVKLLFIPKSAPLEFAGSTDTLKFGASPVTIAVSLEVGVAARNLPDTVCYSLIGANSNLFSVKSASGWSKKRGGNLSVTFTPVDRTPVADAALEVRTKTGGGTDTVITIVLTGVGTEDPALIVKHQGALNFGSATVGLSSEIQRIEVEGYRLTEDTIHYELTGADASAFAVEAIAGWNATAGGVLSLRFLPTEARDYSATLVISSLNINSKVITLTGVGQSVSLPVTPDGDEWYYIQLIEVATPVISGGFVQDLGADSLVRTPAAMNNGSLWKIRSTGITNRYKLVSKLGNELSFDGASFATATAGGGGDFDFGASGSYWKVKYRGASDTYFRRIGDTYSPEANATEAAEFRFLPETSVAPLPLISDGAEERWYRIEWRNRLTAAAQDAGLNASVTLTSDSMNDSLNTAYYWKFVPVAGKIGAYKVVGYSGRELKYSDNIKAVAAGEGHNFALEWTVSGTSTGWALRNLSFAPSSGREYLSSSNNISQWQNHADRLLNITPVPQVLQLSDADGVAVSDNVIPFGVVSINTSEATVTRTFTVRAYNLGAALEYTLTGDDAANFIVTPSADWNSTQGGTATITFAPTAGVTKDYSATLTIRSANNAKTRTLTLTGRGAQTYTFTAQSANAEWGSVSTTPGSGDVEQGAGVTLTATPTDTTLFVGWKNAAGQTVSTDNPFTLTLTQDTTITAVFALKPKYTVTVTVNNSELGSAAGGGGSYYEGSDVTLTATPTDTTNFVSWTNAAGQTVSTNNPFTLTLTQDTALTAVFALKPKYTVTVTVNNSELGSAAGGGSYYEGSNVPLTATPATDAKFVGWIDATGGTVSKSNPYTITVVSDTVLTATFEQFTSEPPVVDVTLSNLEVSAGTLTPAFHPDTLSYAVSVGNAVTSITITATAADGATVAGDGEKTLEVGANTVTITVISGSTTRTYTITVTREAASSTTGVSSLALGTLIVYPNPVTGGVLTIENGALKSGDRVEIYAISGSLAATYEVSAGKVTTINISSLPKGAYIVKLGARAAKVVVSD